MESIITTFLTACVPAFITYLVSAKQSNSKIEALEKSNQLKLDEIKLNHEVQISHMKTELELKIADKENDLKNDMTAKFFNGDLDLTNMSNSITGLANIQQQLKDLGLSQK